MKKSMILFMSMALVMTLVFERNLSVCAGEEASIRARADIAESDYGAYIIVEKKSGEIEAHSLETLLEGAKVISCDEAAEAAPRAYITDYTEADEEYSMRSVRSTHYFDWDIDRNTIVYSDQKLNLEVYDKIYVSVTANTSNYVSYEIGLMNNVNNVFSNCGSVAGDTDRKSVV